MNHMALPEGSWRVTCDGERRRLVRQRRQYGRRTPSPSAQSIPSVRASSLRSQSTREEASALRRPHAGGRNAGIKCLDRERRIPHRTPRCLRNPFAINNLQSTTEFPFPIPFTISIWTQSHSARPLGPAADGWRIGLHPLDGPPAALVPLLGLVPEPCSSTRSPVRWPARSSESSPSEGCSSSRAGGRRGVVGADWDHAGVAAVAGHHHGDRSSDGQGRRADADARLGRR